MAAKTKKDSFGIDADPAEFDIEEWLSGASLPARSVKIFQDGAARARLDKLAEEFEALGRKAKEEAENGSDSTLDDGGALAAQYDVARRMEAIIEETEASCVWVRVRALTSDEFAKLQKRNIPDDALYSHILAVSGRVVSGDREAPAMTAAQWTKFRNKVGDKQFRKIVSAVDDASGWDGSGQVMPDFSPDVSALLSTMES